MMGWNCGTHLFFGGFGRGAIGEEAFDRVGGAIKRLQKSGAIEDPWDVFGLLADELDGKAE